MSCSQVREKLPGLLYGDLNPQEAADVEQHLVACSACQNEKNALGRVRELLNLTRASSIEVDVPRLYHDAAELQSRRPHARRKQLLVMIAIAATVLIAFALNVEFRVEAHQLIVRWGNPLPRPEMSQPAVSALDRPAPTLQVVHEDTDSAHEFKARVRVINDLVHALAADIETRDRRQQQQLAKLQAQLDQLQSQSQRRWTAAERDVAALYTFASLLESGKQGDSP